MSRETTFERDMHVSRDRAILTPALTRLCERVAEDLRGKGYGGRTVGLKLEFADFKVVTRGLSLPEPVADGAVIRRAVGVCLKRLPLDRRIRLIGSLDCATGDNPAAIAAESDLPFDR